MKYRVLFFLALVGWSTNVYADEVVSSGKIVEIEPPKKEIYILADENGKRLEYYFNDATTVVSKGEAKRYEDLRVGQRVKVTAKKIGKRLDPKNVEILD